MNWIPTDHLDRNLLDVDHGDEFHVPLDEKRPELQQSINEPIICLVHSVEFEFEWGPLELQWWKRRRIHPSHHRRQTVILSSWRSYSSSGSLATSRIELTTGKGTRFSSWNELLFCQIISRIISRLLSSLDFNLIQCRWRWIERPEAGYRIECNWAKSSLSNSPWWRRHVTPGGKVTPLASGPISCFVENPLGRVEVGCHQSNLITGIVIMIECHKSPIPPFW